MAVKKPYAAKLDTKITIKQRTTVKGPLMTDEETLVDICTTFAAQDNDTGTLQVDEKIRHEVKDTFVIRTRPGVYNADNLEVHLQDGQKFNVTHVRKLNRSHLIIYCIDHG